MHLEGVFPTTRGPFLCAHFSSVLAWCGRQSCETSHFTTPLLVAIMYVLYRHCYGTEAHTSQGLSRALGKASTSQGVRSRGRSRKGTVQIIEYGVQKSSMLDLLWGCCLTLEPLTESLATINCSLGRLRRLAPVSSSSWARCDL